MTFLRLWSSRLKIFHCSGSCFNLYLESGAYMLSKVYQKLSDAKKSSKEQNMVTLPKIEKEAIKNYCGARMYQIGKDFLKEQPFFVYFREWTMLKALSEGTESPSYAVRILLDDTGIANSCCTCYVNRSVPCKHIAALLILWNEKPDDIPERITWSNDLRKVPQEDLIKLLEKIVDLYPEDESCKLWLVES